MSIVLGPIRLYEVGLLSCPMKIYTNTNAGEYHEQQSVTPDATRATPAAVRSSLSQSQTQPTACD